MLILGACSAIKMRFGGELYLTEVLLLVGLPYLLVRSRPHPDSNQSQRFVLVFGFFWALAQLTSDIVHGSQFGDWSRGLSKVLFLILNFIALRRLLNTERRVLLFAIGIALAGIYKPISLGQETETAWKFGLGSSIAILGLVASSSGMFKKWPLIAPIVVLLLGVNSLFEGSRNLAGVCIVAASLLFLGSLLQPEIRTQPVLRAGAAFAVLGIAFASYMSYGMLSSSGFLGERAKSKYEWQLKRGSGSVLLGGRAEWRISLIAIADSPLLGHGSWAKNPQYAEQYRAQLTAETGERYEGTTGDDIIPSHSHVFGAWVEAGIMGALFWVVVFVFIMRSLLALLSWRFPLGPLATLLGASLLWDIPFSPFGGDRRIHVAFALVLLPIAVAKARRG